jgi:hypothetical protein
MKIAFALVLLVACSSSGAGVQPADAAGHDGALVPGESVDATPAQEAGDTAPLCTDFVHVNKTVTPKLAADSAMPPPPSGGAITPGVYELEEILLYQLTASCASRSELAAPRALSARFTVESPTRGKIEQTIDSLGRPDVIPNVALNYVLDGTKMTSKMYCPFEPDFGDEVGYAAAENEIVTFQDRSGEGCGVTMVVLRRVER